tara:strand:- start:106 stop:753 length:648 start_codon:yes stop_codon:yes gene_type:complete
MDIVEEKGIEKTQDDIEILEKVKEKKPRKPRSEAQKAAFEKARAKRAENLAKKKSQPQNEVSPELEQNQTAEPPKETLPNPAPEEKPKKKRGRPKGSKKLKREPEPPRGTYLPPNIPPEAGDIRYAYQQPPQGHHSQFNPWMAYQPPPQVHNYYYGHQQGAVNQAPEPAPAPAPPPARPITPDYEDSSEESVDYLDPPEFQEAVAPPPDLKYRFA